MPPVITCTDHWFDTRDGRRLFAQRCGAGEPIVVFESGMGASRNTWGAVVEAVSPTTTTVVYDRSGLGRSPVDPAPRDLARLADDLGDVLDAIGADRYVLVGHSWGGPIIRSVAAADPGRIAGLVLVDQTDERCDLFFSDAARRQTNVALRITPVAARLGLLRLLARRFARTLPEPWATAMRAEDGTAAAARAQVAELRLHLEDLTGLRNDPRVLPDVPVTVISGTTTNWSERNQRPALISAHRATAAGCTLGRHVEATRSSHYVPFTEPGLVADEILRIVEMVRR